VTGEASPELFTLVQSEDVIKPAAQPPYPARALSRYLPGGVEVSFLNGRLVDLGFLDDSDPNFYPYAFNAVTEAAIVQFQRKNGFTANGMVDYQVWGAVFCPTAVLPDGNYTLDPIYDLDWSTDFYPILVDPIDLAYDGNMIWVLHSSGENAFDNLLVRVDPNAGLLDQTPPVMLGDMESEINGIVEMLFDGNRIWLLMPRSWDPPQIVSFIPQTAEKFLQTTFAENDPEAFSAYALGYDGTKLWATDNDRAWAINKNTGKGYLSYPVGWMTQGEMAFDGKCMWMAGEAGLTAFHTGGDYACPGESVAYTMPSGPVIFDGQRVWSAGWYGVQWLDIKTGVIGDAVSVGNNPSALAFDGNTLWVANQGDDTVQGIDVATGSVGPTIVTGRQPVALLHDGQQLWVANAGDRTLQRIDVVDYQIEIILPTATPIPSFTPTSAPTQTPTLTPLTRNLSLKSPWMNGEDVQLLQEQLLRLGYTEVGEPDGYFGPMTGEAVRHFQSINQLFVDGIVGPITWELLFSSEAKGP
jgi:YVTN family beta-propeller protein